jgi:hypothetical protein
MDANPHDSVKPFDANAPQRKSARSMVLPILAIVGIVGIVLAMLVPDRAISSRAGSRNACATNLKRIAVALRNYKEVWGALPPAYTMDANGKPLHSWRTLILPFLEEGELYKSIDLTKPWDDPVNAKPRNTLVDTYGCASLQGFGAKTTYLTVVTPNSCLRPGEPRSLSEITDGESKTLIVIEVDSEHAVPWMSPIDADEKMVMSIGPNSKLAHVSGVNAAFVDMHVAFLNAELSARDRRALISIAGNDKAAIEED